MPDSVQGGMVQVVVRHGCPHRGAADGRGSQPHYSEREGVATIAWAVTRIVLVIA